MSDGDRYCARVERECEEGASEAECESEEEALETFC